MNKKYIKSTIILLIFVLSFFCFEIRVYAKYKMTSVRPNNLYSNSFVSKNMNGKTRTLKSLFVFIGSDVNDKPKHAYCIQPGISMAVWNTGNNTRTGDGTVDLLSYTNDEEPAAIDLKYNSYYTDATIKQKVMQVLNYAYEYNPNKTSFTDFANAAKTIEASEYQKIIASQALVWEIITKERTNFNTDIPDQKEKGGLYDVIFGDSKFSTAQNEYKRIRKAVYYSYNKLPGNNSDVFKLESNAATIKTTIGETYEIKDEKNAFSYFKVLNTSDGITAVISDDGSSIKITPTKAISSESPGVVRIALKNTKSNAIAYTCTDEPEELGRTGCQDLAYGGVDLVLAIKVYTGKYDIKILKKDENGQLLSGAKFDVCKDSRCNNVLNDEPLVSDANGIATYSEITEPGTYYVKEIEAPSGYEKHDRIEGVKANGTVNFINTARIFNLTKYTVDEDGNNILLNDGCGTDDYTGPEFQLTDEDGNVINFERLSDGMYKLADDNTEMPVSTLKTCKGKFSAKLLTSCIYTISEVTPPKGLTLPSNPTRKVNICGSDKNISFTNGFTGLEFQKKNEDGEFISGGKFALQRKENNVYKDILLKEVGQGYYLYDQNLKQGDSMATYLLLTNDGIARIKGLSPGEYRIVEKEAPSEYEPIADKDSTAKVTISDGKQDDYYLVELINKKVNIKGDEASAELIVTINTGRKVLNYTFIFIALAVVLVTLIILRKKQKK